MSYVPGFKNDIFISFAHADNWDGWVDQFHDHLSHRLEQIGASVTIWRDRKLRGTDIFSDEIFTQLRQSALLVSILSPISIRSRWCEDERQAFERFAALNGGFRFDNQIRAIKVVKTPLPGDEHRDLFGVLGFEFYDRDTQSHNFNEFDQTSAEFRQLRNRMASDIKSVLDALVVHLRSLPEKETVYVATTTPDLKRQREAVVHQLEDWGYAVAPSDPQLLRGLPVFETVTKAELEASTFSVHLASDHPQLLMEGEHDTVAGQYELAQSLRKDRIVWVSPGRTLYSEFDQVLKHGLQNGVELLKDRGLEDLKDVIGEQLNRNRREPPPAAVKSQAQAELYLICDRVDHPTQEESEAGQRALLIKEYLNESGLLVMPSPFSDMEWSELEDEFGAQLKLSNAVLLYWGMASENWFLKIRRIIVNERMRRNKSSSAGKLTEAFYFTNPPLKKSQYRNLAEFVFEQYEGFYPNDLKPLLDRLLANEEG